MRTMASLVAATAALLVSLGAAACPGHTHAVGWTDGDGNRVEVHSHPGTVNYGEWGGPPYFEDLDANGDGVIDEDEAAAYPPLANDFLLASGGKDAVTPARYEWWANSSD